MLEGFVPVDVWEAFWADMEIETSVGRGVGGASSESAVYAVEAASGAASRKDRTRRSALASSGSMGAAGMCPDVWPGGRGRSESPGMGQAALTAIRLG
ncbi:MAG TPA: hypothetical protein VGB31_07430 [Myxococcota bacterium]